MSTEPNTPASIEVSVVIPCRNEVRHIRPAVESLLSGGIDAGRMEILVVDGRSDDGTIDLLEKLAREYANVRRVDNPERTTPTALNRGIRECRGRIVVRADAHCVYPDGYLARLVEASDTLGCANVGPRVETVPGSSTPSAKAIAIALGSSFGVGGARFRTESVDDRPVDVDTVPFGCFPRGVFDRYGLFDEDLVRNQDDEFNLRLRTCGERVVLLPDLVVEYVGRSSLSQLGRMYYQYGLFKPTVMKRNRSFGSWRQWIPAGFLASLVVLAVLGIPFPLARVGLAGIGSLYLSVSALAAFRGTRKVDSDRGAVLVRLVMAFGTMHLAYGAGFIAGLVHLVRRKESAARDLSMSRS